MLRKEIERIYNNLDIKTSLKVQIILLKNKRKLKEEFELISDVYKNLNLEEYKDYLIKLDKLTKEKKSLNDINNLKEEFKDVIKEQSVRNSQYFDFINEDVKIDFEYYSLEDLPEDLSKYKEIEIETLIKFVKE